MTLTAGTHLGPYEIVGALGAGGMGEVYRARDPRLGRDVAIKVLPAGVSHDVAGGTTSSGTCAARRRRRNTRCRPAAAGGAGGAVA
jgi:serine/threonine protein kinase